MITNHQLRTRHIDQAVPLLADEISVLGVKVDFHLSQILRVIVLRKATVPFCLLVNFPVHVRHECESIQRTRVIADGRSFS